MARISSTLLIFMPTSSRKKSTFLYYILLQ